MTTPRPPEAVGPVSGTTPPARLPWIGTKVVDPDGTVGVVATYQYYRADQVWFPVEFGRISRQRRLGKKGNKAPWAGFVRLANPPPVTDLATARKPPQDGCADGVAEQAAAS